MQIINKNLYKEAINNFGTSAQVIIAMEECSELIKELSKTFRGETTVENISEEIADVQIMIEQLKIIFRCENLVNRWVMNKNYRIAELIEEQKRKFRDVKGVQIEL